MRTFLLLVAAIAVAVQAVPYALDSDYAMVPDADGRFKLINVKEEAQVENFFEPTTDVIFLLFTSQNPTQGQVIRWNDPETVAESNFNPNNPTR